MARGLSREQPAAPRENGNVTPSGQEILLPSAPDKKPVPAQIQPTVNVAPDADQIIRKIFPVEEQPIVPDQIPQDGVNSAGARDRGLNDEATGTPQTHAPTQSANGDEISADQPPEKPISQKIDDLAAVVNDLKNALAANQILPEASESTPIATADEIFDKTSQPEQDMPDSPAAAPSNVPAGFRAQAEELAQKLEGLKAETGGRTYSMFFPGLDPTTAKLMWNAAVSVAQNLVRAGGTAADAIDAAISHIRKNFAGAFDERGARAALSSSLADTGSFREWGKYDLRKVPAGSDPVALSQSFPKSETRITPQEPPKTSDGLRLWAKNQLAKLPGVVRSPWGNEVALYKGNDVASRANDYISGGESFGPSRERAMVLPMVAQTIRNAMASATVRDRPWSAYLYRYADGQLHAVIVDNDKGTVEKQFVLKPDPRDPNFKKSSDFRVLYRNGIEGIPWETLALEQVSKRQIPLPSAVETSLGSQKIDRLFNRLKLEQFETSPYGQFRKFPRDKLAGHELLQNAWLRKNGYGGPVFPQNPAMALPQKFHAGFVTPMQYEFGLHHRANLARMTAEENILFNAEILRRLNVPHAAIEQAVNASLQYAKTLSKPGQ
jgi:hypothetical protein